MRAITKWFLIFSAGFLLSGCLSQKTYNPMDRFESGSIETIEGTVLPFSVNIATDATHRLEREGKLVAFLASDVVDLTESEGQYMEVSGVFEAEKMRQIFWIQSAEKTEKGTVEVETDEKKSEQFTADMYRFDYPSTWKFIKNEDGVQYFSDKNDALNRVFMSFESRNIKNESQEYPLTIAGLKAYKNMQLDEDGTERQEVLLKSVINEGQEYRFWFQSDKNEFDKKRAFSAALNSFSEGEQVTEEVQEETEIQEKTEEVKSDDAEIKNDTDEKADIDIVDTENENTEEEIKEDKIPNLDTDAPTLPENNAAAVSIPEDGSYKNLVADGSKFHTYTSSASGIDIRIPYRYWYRNFGARNGAVTEMGFSIKGDPADEGSEFTLRVEKTNNPPSKKSESAEGQYLTITVPRNNATLYKITGPASARDAMMSVAGSIPQ